MTDFFKMHPHKDDIITGICGFALTAFGVITSMQEQLLWGVQLLSASGAAIVAIVTLYKMSKKKKP